MNISEQLMVEMSRRNADYIANYIGSDTHLFKTLVDLVFSGKPPLPQRASWVITAVTDKYPDLLKPYLKRIISQIEKFDHPGTRRNLLKYIADNEIPPSTEGKLYDVCYQWLLSRNEPPAVKVHSMQVLYNIAEKEPDLKNELRLILEELSNHESAAIKSRCRQLLAKI
ncbi:MAG TPA: hypothetical protein VIH57_13355 [Bacteroidales bacterium]